MTANKTPGIFTRLTPKLLRQLTRFAKRKGLSISAASRMIMLQYFEGKKIGE